MLKVLVLLAVGFAHLFALNSVEININDKDLELGASVDMSLMNDNIEPDTVFLGLKFLDGDKENSDFTTSGEIDTYYEVSFLMQKDFDANLEIGLGMKFNSAKNFKSFPLGGQARYELDTVVPVYVGGSIYYAPSVLAMSDAKSFMEYRVSVDIELIENAMVTLGYRSLDTNYDKPVAKDVSYNSSVYAGLKFRF